MNQILQFQFHLDENQANTLRIIQFKEDIYVTIFHCITANIRTKQISINNRFICQVGFYLLKILITKVHDYGLTLEWGVFNQLVLKVRFSGDRAGMKIVLNLKK